MSETLQGGGTPQVHVFHDLHPEDGAMLQALYSRSPASVLSHLEKVKTAGSGQFMSQYYVGYGHASIGDCGVTTIFIENYSMLAAKAIQDNPLYAGQEASTRYLDFAQQGQVDPYDHSASRAVLDGWMALYNQTMPQLKAALAVKHPFEPAQHKSEKVWQSAINARAFDIMRGFLPIGCTTLFSWTTNLRQARDKLVLMQHHPLPEMQELAKTLYATLLAKYPNSYAASDLKAATGQSERGQARQGYYAAEAVAENFETLADLQAAGWLDAAGIAALKRGQLVVNRESLQAKRLATAEAETLARRPGGAALPKRLAAYGSYNVVALLDFGSYRDLQRHRNGVCRVPLVANHFGIHPWYLQQVQGLLDEATGAAFAVEVNRLLGLVDKLPAQGVPTTALLNQYLYPMGLALACHITYAVPQMVYVAELRSLPTVHATLRPVAQQLGAVLQEDFPAMALYIDGSEDGWSAKRGEQDIVAAAKAA